MALEFDSRHMIVSRQKVYNRTTGRYLGEESDFDTGPVGVAAADDDFDAATADKKPLKAKAKELGIPGFSSMNKDELRVAILAVMLAGEDSDGSDQSGTESSDEADST